jgi:multidrug resistance efflux pump
MPAHAHSKEKTRDRRPLIVASLLIIIVGGGIAAGAYILASGKTVYIDKAQIAAPTVTLSPAASGVLHEVDVSVGDTVAPNTVVAVVGNQLIKTTQGGLVITINDNIGKLVSPQDTIVEVIDPTELRVVGQVQEDKGLVDIHPGQRATFTVDAFGGQQFSGIVDEVSPTAQSGDVVFSVSDKRQEQDFDVKVRYDIAAHPELRNGMSAKIWVFKQ